jgi:5-methylcytosine-specific restriction endonuclease McrA
MKKVLLLNASEEILQFIEWKRAISLLFSGKAEPPYNYEHGYEIPHSSGIFYLPAAIRLKNYIFVPPCKAVLTRKNIHRRDNCSCQYCGVKLDPSSISIDHVIPRSRGGRNTWENLVSCCRNCNTKKSNRTPKEANMKLLCSPRQPKFLNSTELKVSSIWSRWA